MKNIVIFCLLLISTLWTKAQTNTYFYIKGNILDCQKNCPISYAHIINETSGFATASDSLGLFAIKGKIDDILKISSVGYKNKFLLVTENLCYLRYHYFTRSYCITFFVIFAI